MLGTKNIKFSCYLICSTLISHTFLDFAHTCLSGESVPYFSLSSRFAGSHKPFKPPTACNFTHISSALSELTKPRMPYYKLHSMPLFHCVTV